MNKLIINKMTFRIIEERKTLSNTSKFFIQKKHGFFIFTWWKKIKNFSLNSKRYYIMEFETYEDAKNHFDYLNRQFNDKIVVIVRN